MIPVKAANKMKLEELATGRKVVDRTLEQMGTGTVRSIEYNIVSIEFDGIIMKYGQEDLEFLVSVI